MPPTADLKGWVAPENGSETIETPPKVDARV
jgi:hypothetical protein